MTTETSNAREWKDWMRDREQVVGLADHLEQVGWRQDERGDVQCFDQGAAMAAEVIRLVLLPMLDAPPPAAARGDVRGLVALAERVEGLLTAFGDSDMRAERDAIAADLRALAAEGVRCETCNDRGQVGGPVGQTAESFGYETFPCPDCAEGVQAPKVDAERALKDAVFACIAEGRKTGRYSGVMYDGGHARVDFTVEYPEGVQAGEVEQRARYTTDPKGDGYILRDGLRMTADEIVAALSQQPEARGVVDGEVTFNAAFFVSRSGNRIEQMTTYDDYRCDGALLALMALGQKRASARGLTKKNAGKVTLAWVTAPQIVECDAALTGERNG